MCQDLDLIQLRRGLIDRSHHMFPSFFLIRAANHNVGSLLSFYNRDTQSNRSHQGADVWDRNIIVAVQTSGISQFDYQQLEHVTQSSTVTITQQIDLYDRYMNDILKQWFNRTLQHSGLSYKRSCETVGMCRRSMTRSILKTHLEGKYLNFFYVFFFNWI